MVGKEKDVKLAMMITGSSALDFLKKNPNADSEQVMKHVMRDVRAEGEAKIAGIAAANFVIKLKEKGKITDKKALQELANSTSEILNSISQENAPETSEMLDLQ